MPQSKNSQKDLLLASGLALVFAAINFYWFCLDHRLPPQDAAGHILNCFAIRDLLAHCRFWNPHWWYQLLTVNNYYPPTYYLTCGFLKLLFGPGYLVDAGTVVLFNFLLSLGTFGVARYLNLSRFSSVLAVIIINFFPLVSSLSHAFMLDLPLLSMVTVGIWSLLFWRDKPSWGRAVIAGLILTASALTKQLAIPYMVATGVWLLVESTGLIDRRFKREQTLQLLLIALIVVTGCLPWAAINVPIIRSNIAFVESVTDAKAVQYSFLGTVGTYLGMLPDDITPLLAACAVLGIVLSSRKTHRDLLPATLAGVTGMSLMFAIQRLWPVDNRYIAPGMLFIALYASVGISSLCRSRFRLVSVSAAAIMSLACLQYISFNFAPYPLANPAFIAGVSKGMGVKLLTVDKDNPRGVDEDWGQNFVLDTIYKNDHEQPAYLNIMANHSDMNAHSFMLLCKMRKSQVMPTTSRFHTSLGDKVTFDPKAVLYCDWYLFKDGDPGYKYFDKKSSDAVDHIRQFVSESGYFELAAKKELPDHTDLYLFRKLPDPHPTESAARAVARFPCDVSGWGRFAGTAYISRVQIEARCSRH